MPPLGAPGGWPPCQPPPTTHHNTARRQAGAGTAHITSRQTLLACGILYVVLYPIVNDVIAATMYDGYSRRSGVQPVADRLRGRNLARLCGAVTSQRRTGWSVRPSGARVPRRSSGHDEQR